ncbi:MAG: 1,4-alpha-glucan-branching protein [Ignavibacteriales bacterium]|nr:1,4-alpha-glucan-branching protein [Ignavibacteriales bacterium]
MKKFTLVVALLQLFSLMIFAQAIITVPQFPTENAQVEITFNIKEMSNTTLIGYTGVLYAHTGVNTNLGNWQHVIGEWGDNTIQPTLIRVSPDIYKITIPNPRTYYIGIESNEHITSLNFVLRSADKSKQTEDLFIEIYEEGFNLKLLDTESINFYPLPGEKIDLTAVTNGSDSLIVYLDDLPIWQTTDDTLFISFFAKESGRQWLKYIAYHNGNIYSDSVSFIIRSNLTIEELPSGLLPGINYIDNNTVTLALYAPKKKFVYAIGDFNNWEFDQTAPSSWLFDDKYYFKLTPDSTIYWLNLTNLTPNKEYRFQYVVDGNLRIADPYSDKILEEEDSDITDATYPNLIPYPTDKTYFSVSIFETGQSAFEWEANDYVKPEKENLIIYELLIRDFVATHDYKTLIDTLDYLEKLGINAVELMPINEFEGNESWGYNPSFYFAPDKYYGPKNDLKKFIDECHKRDIAVIMDIVLNHSYGRSSFVRLYSSGNFGPPTSENPWYNVNSPNPVFSWGYDFNHEKPQTKILVDRINKYWLEEYKFDGFRYDFTKGFTNTPGDGSNYDQSRINILKRMADSIWAFDSTAYVILEHFAPDTEERILTDYGMMVWGNNNYNYSEATMGYSESGKSDFSRISYKNHSFTKPNLVGYMESHDEERLMYKNLQYGNSSEIIV